MATSIPAQGATASPGGFQDAMQIQPDGYAHVQGVVRENLRGCERDLPCALRLQLLLQGQRHDVQLLYHLGEGEAACREALVRQGLAVQPGTRVQARGRHRMAGTLHLVDLCSPPGGTLRIVPP